MLRGDLNAATRGPFIWSLISCLYFDEVQIGVSKQAAIVTIKRSVGRVNMPNKGAGGNGD